ncbi:hypothetical protein K0M31_007824 [Melipona bicolor]|uniref:Uncharacterized protein n=1 Tax=Melipona bicolor TaxID=60889 RepID=A0AA40GC37_9HYME|nr:hypothetical protein K0M31_007824 [Melipona bicolor]
MPLRDASRKIFKGARLPAPPRKYQLFRPSGIVPTAKRSFHLSITERRGPPYEDGLGLGPIWPTARTLCNRFPIDLDIRLAFDIGREKRESKLKVVFAIGKKLPRNMADVTREFEPAHSKNDDRGDRVGPRERLIQEEARSENSA